MSAKAWREETNDRLRRLGLPFEVEPLRETLVDPDRVITPANVKPLEDAGLIVTLAGNPAFRNPGGAWFSKPVDVGRAGPSLEPVDHVGVEGDDIVVRFRSDAPTLAVRHEDGQWVVAVEESAPVPLDGTGAIRREWPTLELALEDVRRLLLMPAS